jgi:hypothetical protein
MSNMIAIQLRLRLMSAHSYGWWRHSYVENRRHEGFTKDDEYGKIRYGGDHFDEPSSDPQRSAVDILAEAPGHRLFNSADEVDSYVRTERGAWDR